jgi:hypothetical protein
MLTLGRGPHAIGAHARMAGPSYRAMHVAAPRDNCCTHNPPGRKPVCLVALEDP